MTILRKMRSRLTTVLFLCLAGGTLCGIGSCQSRLKESVVAGAQDFLTTLLSPDNVLTILGDLDN